MSQGSETKMYVALGVLAVLGGGYYMQLQSQKDETARHSVAGAQKELPTIALSEEETGKITKIVLDKPAESEGDSPAPAEEITLEKDGDTWKVVEPVDALANQQNVESLLKNLNKLSVKEQVGKNKESYAQYDVSDDKALHASFYEGDKLIRGIWAGKSGGRGQMARIDGSDGVYVIDGYSSFLYNRKVKGWRDLSIVELDKEEVKKVTVENEAGTFVFEKTKEKSGDEAAKWSGMLVKKTGNVSSIKDFDPKKIDDLLNAYKKLNASDFGDKKTLAETGLENPKAKLTFYEGDKQIVILLGDNAEGSARWAKLQDKDQIFSISSWAADWGTAEESKFQKKDDDADATPPPSASPPMGMPMGMPPGHP